MPSPRIPIVRLLLIVWLAALPLRAAAQETAVADDYVFGPGDLLNIAVWKNQNYTGYGRKTFTKPLKLISMAQLIADGTAAIPANHLDRRG